MKILLLILGSEKRERTWETTTGLGWLVELGTLKLLDILIDNIVVNANMLIKDYK